MLTEAITENELKCQEEERDSKTQGYYRNIKWKLINTP